MKESDKQFLNIDLLWQMPKTRAWHSVNNSSFAILRQ